MGFDLLGEKQQLRMGCAGRSVTIKNASSLRSRRENWGGT
jgi:hypothetical protein